MIFIISTFVGLSEKTKSLKKKPLAKIDLPIVPKKIINFIDLLDLEKINRIDNPMYPLDWLHKVCSTQRGTAMHPCLVMCPNVSVHNITY